jgi:hypothetical protein
VCAGGCICHEVSIIVEVISNAMINVLGICTHGLGGMLQAVLLSKLLLSADDVFVF